MKVFDCHLHLPDNMDLESGMRKISEDLSDANISRGLLLHLETQPWTYKEVSKEFLKYSNISAFVNVNPKKSNCVEEFCDAIENYSFIGLKVHPRLLEHSLEDAGLISLISAASELNVPVLIDAFPDGTHLMQGFNLNDYVRLAKMFPSVRFIWAHMAGHYVLDFMMVAKRLNNVFFDISYALLYYRGSRVPQDMIYAIKSMRGDKVFYGSDFPDRGIKETLDLSLDVFSDFKLDEGLRRKVLETNARDFYNW